MVGKYDTIPAVHPTINDAVIIHTQKLRGDEVEFIKANQTY